jgi:hypothetical protein
MTNYKIFEYDYDKDSLLSLYSSLKNEGKSKIELCFNAADLTNVPHESLPYMNVYERTLAIGEYGLAELLSDTGYHVNPGNNGLIIFPVSGVINFTFEDGTSIDITQPTYTNGKVSHTYSPKDGSAVFFAIKIPSDVAWED